MERIDFGFKLDGTSMRHIFTLPAFTHLMQVPALGDAIAYTSLLVRRGR